jgi:hypothetical protein
MSQIGVRSVYLNKQNGFMVKQVGRQCKWSRRFWYRMTARISRSREEVAEKWR